MQKLQQIKQKNSYSFKKIDESSEIKEQRIEGAIDKRRRVSEATNIETQSNLKFEEVHTDSQWSKSNENGEQFSLSIFDIFNEFEITRDDN